MSLVDCVPLAAAFAALAAYGGLVLDRGPPPGLQRALWVVPAVALCFYTPALTPWVIPRVVLGCTTMWLSAFKLMCYAANRGPLARPDLTTSQRVLLLLLPVNPRSPRWGPPPSLAWTCVVLASKVALQAAVVAVLTTVQLPPVVVHSLWAVSIWNCVAMAVDATVPVVQAALGLPVGPSMDQPYLSVTIHEFWSKRYNIVATSCLRQSVYDPVIDGCLVRKATPVPPQLPPAESPSPVAADCAGAAAAALEKEDSGALAAAPGAGVGGASDPSSGSESEENGSPREAAAAGGAGACAGADAPPPRLPGRRGAGDDTTGGLRRRAVGAAAVAAAAAAKDAGSVGGGGGGDDAAPSPDSFKRAARGGAAAAAAGGAKTPLSGSPRGNGAPALHTVWSLASQGSVAWQLLGGPAAPTVSNSSGSSGKAAAADAAARPAAAAVPEWRRSVATFAVFVVSGLLHEAIVAYACAAPAYDVGARYVFGPVLAFFALQAPAMQAEKWVLAYLSKLRARVSPKQPPPPSKPAVAAAAAAGLPRRAASALLRAAARAARVCLVYTWLWGLADYTFWASTQSCRIEDTAIPELAAAFEAARAAAVRAAAALQLGGAVA